VGLVTRLWAGHARHRALIAGRVNILDFLFSKAPVTTAIFIRTLMSTSFGFLLYGYTKSGLY
jgi:hypothetical protein